MEKWIKAFRLRTLPLALACVGMGSFLAAGDGKFRLAVLIWSLITTLFLQILSNLSNDYGDYIHGADHSGRSGPARTVSAGEITPGAMRIAIISFALLSFLSGLILLKISISVSYTFIAFLILGILAIGAAIYYTMGKKPYGYSGFGDLAVFLFFGWVGVIGTYYLHSGQINWINLLPATTCSVFAVAVLNINNIRDITSDRKAGKNSIPVRIGRKRALIYHNLLLITGMICAVVYSIVSFASWWSFIYLLVIPLLWKNATGMQRNEDPKAIDPFLKQMALTTLIFVLLFGTGLLIP